MKITPVLQHITTNRVGHTMPVWEIEDFPMPLIDINECSIIGPMDQKNPDVTANFRLSLSYNFSDTMKNQWEYTVKEFMHHMKSVGYADYSINYLWFDRLYQFSISPLTEHIAITCDKPGLNMGSHLDNRNMFGIMILNMIDNPEGTGTEFSRTYNGEVLYTSPTKKNSGVFFMNTHETWHAIKNMSTSNRYIFYIPIGI